METTQFTAAPTVAAPSIFLRCTSAGDEPLTPEINQWPPNVLGVEVHDYFGQTEAGMLVNNHHHPALKEAMSQEEV